MAKNETEMDRRSLLRGAVVSALSLIGLSRSGRSWGAEEPRGEAKLDERPGRVSPLTRDELGKFPKIEGKPSESFGVTLPNGQRHLFRVSEAAGGGALVESIGPRGEKKSVSFREGESPLPHLQQKPTTRATGNAFWACWINNFISRVGQAIWNNLRNNFINCWNQANKKKLWYQKLAAFLACISNVPYVTYAIQAWLYCK